MVGVATVPMMAGWLVAGFLAGSCWAGADLDYGVRSLSGLSAVRLEFAAGEGPEAVDAEVVLLERLHRAGITVSRGAPAVLRVDLRAAQGLVSADLSLSQAVCLERDPVVTDQVATWSQGASIRGDDASGALAALVEEFVRDWQQANGPR